MTVAVGGQSPAATITLVEDRDLGSGSATVTWGDGQTTAIPFVRSAASSTITIPGHAYAVAGRFVPSVSIPDAAGNVGSALLAPVTVVAPPESLERPIVVGATRVGRTVTCRVGSWEGANSYAFQWLVGGREMPDATERSFRLRAADRGRRVACAVTASNAGGEASAVSRSRLVGREKRR